MSSDERPGVARVSQDLLNRFARTLGKKPASTFPITPPMSTPTSPASMSTSLSEAMSSPITNPTAPTTPSSVQFGAELRRTESASSVASSLKRKIALSGLGVTDFFKKLSKDIVNIGRASPSLTPEPSSTPKINESPPSLHAVQQPPQRGPAYAAAGGGHAKLLSVVAEGEEDVPDSDTDNDNATGFPLPSASASPPLLRTTDTPTSPSPIDADYLAHRIQELIDNLPPPQSPHRRGRTIPLPVPLPPKTTPPKKDKNGKPIPPPGAAPVPIEDPELLAFLQSATVMNGGKDVEKPTVWDMLQRLGAPPHWMPGQGSGGDESGGNDRRGGGDGGQNTGDDDGGGGRDDEPDSIFADTGSVMMYSPLIPTRNDIVELAEAVPMYFEEEVPAGEQEVEAGVATIPVSRWATMWPLGSWFGASQAQEKAAAAAEAASASVPEIVLSPPPANASDLPRSPYMGSPRLGEGGKKYRVRSQRAWVPSADKVSYEVMWWGYRVYLPPPAMLVLSDKSIEAQKRAALLTGALTWFFNNIPVDVLPLPFQPTVLLLQRLAPYLGYIGTFIAWSWSTVKSYDLGFGVILSATWLLPIALVPGTWFENQFPKSPVSSPLPLPPDDSTPLPPSSPPSPTAPTTPHLPVPQTPLPGSGTPTESSPSLPQTPTPPPNTTVPEDDKGGSGEGEDVPTSPPPTYPTPSIPLPPESPISDDPAADPNTEPHDDPNAGPNTDESGRIEMPWNPRIGITQSSPSPPHSSISPSQGIGTEIGRGRGGHGRGGSPDKRGWGRFQVLRGAPKDLFEHQSFAVAPASPGGWTSANSSVSGTPSSAWGTPVGSPRMWENAPASGELSSSSPSIEPLTVQPGSPLMDELLKSRRVGTVALPSESVENLQVKGGKEGKGGKRGVKALFGVSGGALRKESK